MGLMSLGGLQQVQVPYLWDQIKTLRRPRSLTSV